MKKLFQVWIRIRMFCFVGYLGFCQFEYPQCGGANVQDPVAIGRWPFCSFCVCLKSPCTAQNTQCLLASSFPPLFLSPHGPSFSALTFAKLFPSFSFLKANMPCETWSTGFLEGTTATMQGVRPCQMTPWRLCAAPCMKWSPRTWRMPRPYGMLVASRSWSASPKAKEISKSGMALSLHWSK